MAGAKPGRESAHHPRCFRCDAPVRVNRNDRRRGPDLVCESCRRTIAAGGTPYRWRPDPAVGE